MGVAAQHAHVVPPPLGQDLQHGEPAEPHADGEQVQEHRRGAHLVGLVPCGVPGHAGGEGREGGEDREGAGEADGGAEHRDGRRRRGGEQPGQQPHPELGREEHPEVGAEAGRADGLAGRDRVGEGEGGAAREGRRGGGAGHDPEGARAIGVLAQQPAGHHGAAEGERGGEVAEGRGDWGAEAGDGPRVEQDEVLAAGGVGREDGEQAQHRERGQQREEPTIPHEAITRPTHRAPMPAPTLSRR
jgi:hypothetical protein